MNRIARDETRLPRHAPGRSFALAAMATALLSVGCSSDDGSTEVDSEISMSRPKVATVQKGDKSIKRYDVDGNGQADVIETIEIYQDPSNEDVTKRRLVKKEVDVNADGQIDIVTVYNDRGKRKKETVDSDLDGKRDSVSYYDGDNLVRKALYGSDGKTVVATRFYRGGSIARVERDRNGDGKTDYWEYYEDGELQRIGQDRDGDEKIDSWTHRADRRATRTATDAAAGPDLEGGNPETSSSSSSEDGGGGEGDGSEGGS